MTRQVISLPAERSVLLGQNTEGEYKAVRVTRGRSLAVTPRDGMGGFNAVVTPDGALKVGQVTNHVGGVFGTFPPSTEKWSSVVTNGGTVAAAKGNLTIATNTTANGTASFQSVDVSRFIPANYQAHTCDIRMDSVTNTDNAMRFGAFNPQDASATGLFWEFAGGEWNLCTLYNDITTKIPQSAWNGSGAASFASDTMVHRYEIYFSPVAVLWWQDGDLIHTEQNSPAPYVDTLHLKTGFNNVNTNGNTTNNVMYCRNTSIYSVGSGQVFPPRASFKDSSGATLIQSGPGSLRRLIISRLSGGSSSVTIYDSLTASGKVVAVVAVAKDDTFNVEFNVVFSIGLVVSHSSTGVNNTIIWD